MINDYIFNNFIYHILKFLMNHPNTVWNIKSSEDLNNHFTKGKQVISSPSSYNSISNKEDDFISNQNKEEEENKIISELEQNDAEKINGKIPKNAKKINFQPENSKIAQTKNRVLSKLKILRATNNTKKAGASLFSMNSRKFTEMTNDPFSRNVIFSFENTETAPILYNNLRMFVSKIRNLGYMNDYSNLNPQDFKIINDLGFYDHEKEKISSKRILRMILKLFSPIYRFVSQNILTEKLLIHPYNNYKIIWDVINMINILFFFIYIPLTICFPDIILSTISVNLCSSMLIIDLLLEMNTIYFKCGIEMKNRKKIVVNYLVHDFFFDVIPLIGIYMKILQVDFFQMLDLLYFLKIWSILRTNKRLSNRFQIHNKMKGIKDLITFILLIMIVAHLISCFWVYVGLNYNNTHNWLENYSLQDKTWDVQYLNSFYWSLVTIMTVGYGDIIPQNNVEKIYTLFVILFGCMMLPYSINCIGLIIQKMKQDENRVE